MDASKFQRIAKALADPRRFEILEVIAAAGEEICCGGVVECFPVAQATVSHHLKELTDAGLVETRAEGQFKYLRARPDIVAEYAEELKRRISAPQSKTLKQKRTRQKSALA
jgi:ArsR family transcriptional regulator, arsenate/arsenite/antimonite-responsive transcriptional repressor